VIEKANAGDPISSHLKASTWNAFVDVANKFRNRVDVGLELGAGNSEDPAHTVMVKNNSGADLVAGSILALNGPIISPTENIRAFKTRIGFLGVTPAASNHGQFVVLREPIGSGRIGLAALTGVVQTKVEISHTWLKRCDITAGSTTKLTAKPEGSAQILWIESGTGEKNALVRLNACRDAVAFGKPASNIAAGSTATITLWVAGAATTYTVSGVEFSWMTGGQQISAGKQVMLQWFADELKWRITGAECEA